MRALDGQCAIVTGCAYGIGLAAARRLAEAGAHVFVTDIKGHDQAASELTATGHSVTALHLDVTSEASVERVVGQAMAERGRIDILVNNAAISAELRHMPFEEQSTAEWRRIMEVNVIGVFNMCRAVSPHMRAARKGRIVNIASGTAFKGAAGMLHYIASKGAIISMTRSLANELGSDNITVNAVSPGLTLTESVQASNTLMAAATIAQQGRFLKRDAAADDVAAVIAFLATQDSGFVTGQTIAADGGSVMH